MSGIDITESLPALAPAQEFEESEVEVLARNEVVGKPPPVLARFYLGAVRDMDASAQAGAPVYRDQVLVLVQVVVTGIA